MIKDAKQFTDIVQMAFYSISSGRIKLSPFAVFTNIFKTYAFIVSYYAFENLKL